MDNRVKFLTVFSPLSSIILFCDMYNHPFPFVFLFKNGAVRIENNQHIREIPDIISYGLGKNFGEY